MRRDEQQSRGRLHRVLQMHFPKWSVLLFAIAFVRPWSLDSVGIAAEPTSTGRLYLVGMGPGDPDLITLRGAKVLESADQVICFPYMEKTVRPFVKQGTLTVETPLLMARFVRLNLDEVEGEVRDKVVQSQKEQERFLTHLRELLASGKTVAIADAGDTTIFCPWLWTLGKLTEIHATIVPAVSSFNAANAVFGADVIGQNSAVMLSCGQELGTANDKGRLETTLVFFAHRISLSDLVQKLSERYPADTPVAIVCDAGYVEKERIVRGTLSSILATVAAENVSPLHLIYVGDAVSQSKKDAVRCPCGKEKP
jgi:precorrin-4/cobalt-precorrin-4 C11-methyltransferase